MKKLIYLGIILFIVIIIFVSAILFVKKNNMLVVDSYPEINFNFYFQAIGNPPSINEMIGQSFTASGNYTLTSAQFYLYGVGSPTGNVYAKLYSHSGVYGTSSVGDTLLATSDIRNANTITPGSWGVYDFTFSGTQKYNMVSGSKHVIVVSYNDGDASNHLYVGGDSGTLGHSGNKCNYLGSWGYENYEIIFYVNGTLTVTGPTHIATPTRIGTPTHISTPSHTGIPTKF
jgi:hypothetical protein